MTSFADSEKRLIAAFGRIDAALDNAASLMARPVAEAVTAEIIIAEDAPEELAAIRAENSALKRRLATSHEEAARLARANEALSRANAELVAGGTDTEAALRAELAALKAARQAEIAALDEIMTGLEALIARAPRASDAPYAEDVTPAPADIVAFDQREG
jgi:chromosome segregation ATPase